MKKLKVPSPWVAILLYASTLVVCPLAVATILVGCGHGVFAVVSYTVCTLLFVYTMYVAISSFNRAKARFHEKTDKIEFMRKLHVNPSFRTIVFGLITIGCNVGYAVFLIVMAQRVHSSWYAMLAVYTIALFLTRTTVLVKNGYDNKRYKFDPVRLKKGKLDNYLLSGVMLLVLTVVLAVFAFVCVTVGGGMKTPRWAIYFFAVMAVYRIGMAIVNFVKAQSYEDLTARSVRYTNLATAFVSVLTLQASIMASYPPTFNPRSFTLLLSSLVCSVGIVLGVLMIVFACRMKKQIERAEQREEQTLGTSEGYNRDGYIEEYGKNNEK